MIEIFEYYVKDRFINFIEQNYSNYNIAEVGKGNSRELVRFELNLIGSLSVFIQLRFVKNRDYVIPSIQWSKLNRFPSEGCITEEDLFDSDSDLLGLDQFDEIWLTACEFGRQDDSFEIYHDTPGRERLEQIFNKKEHKKIIDDANITDWETDEIFHSWDMIEALFPSVLNREDAKYALDKMIAELEKFITAHFMPYLDGVVSRAL